MIRRNIFILLFIFLAISNNRFCQVQHRILGIVIDEMSKPLTNISLRLSHIGSTVTDDNGEFYFNLPIGVDPGSKIEFTIKDAVVKNDTLVIFEPLRGIWNVPKDPFSQQIKIVLLPKGDHRLLDKDGLKLLINEMIQGETSKLQAKVKNLNYQLSVLAMKDPIEEEAKRIGFTKEKLLESLVKFKNQLIKSSDPYDAGLAALFDKHFSKASKLILESLRSDEKIILGKIKGLSEKYLNLGNAYLGENYFLKAKAAYEKSISLDSSNYQGYLKLANINFFNGNTSTSLKNLRHANTIIRKNKNFMNSSAEAVVLNEIGLLFSNTGEYDSSLVYQTKSLNINREVNYPKGEASNLNNIGLIFMDIGKPDSAIAYYNMALKILLQIGCTDGIASVKGNLGTIFLHLGNFAQAQVYHRSVYNYFKSINDHKGEAISLDYLGRILERLGKMDSAKICFQTALQLHKKVGDKIGQSISLSNLGDLFSALDDPDSAYICYQKSLSISRSINNKRGEGNALTNCGTVFQDHGQVDSSFYFYQKALNIFNEIGYKQGKATVLGCLGLLAAQLGMINRSIIYLKQALKINQDIEFLDGEANILGNLGIIFHDIGVSDSARFYYKASLQIYRNTNHLYGEATILSNLGSLYMNVPDSSLVYLHKAKTLFSKMNSPKEKWIDSLILKVNKKQN